MVHTSYSSLKHFIAEVLGHPVIRREIADTLKKIFTALKAPYEEALDILPEQPLLNIDKTRYKENSHHFWTYFFTVLRILTHRSSEVPN